MKPYDLSQLDACANGQILPMVTGKLVSLWERKSGENDRGTWSFQRGYLEQNGIKVPLQIKNREELPQSWRDKDITIKSKDGSKGLNGVKVVDEEHEGVTTRKLRITATAIIAEASAAPAPDHDTRSQEDGWPDEDQIARDAEAKRIDQEQAAIAQESQQPVQKPAQQPASKEPDPLVESRRTIMQITNLHLLCAKAVDGYEAKALKNATGMDMSESQRQGATASIFIEACKNGLVRQMPSHPMTDDK